MDNIEESKQRISNFATRSERTSWMRKRKNLSNFIEQFVNPIELQLQELREKLQPFYDEITSQRTEMVDSCIHPAEELRYNHETGVIQCTFCNTTFKDLERDSTKG